MLLINGNREFQTRSEGRTPLGSGKRFQRMKTKVVDPSQTPFSSCPIEFWDVWHSQAVVDEAADRLTHNVLVPLSVEEVETVTRVLDIFDGELVSVVRKGKR